MDWVQVAAMAEAVAVPLVVWAMQRGLSRKLDDFDRKRDDARRERTERARRAEQRQEAIECGIRSLLRAELIHEHRKWAKRGYCPLESKEYVERMYEAYHGLGGNGVGTGLYTELMELPTEEGVSND
jgi:hypothetical protein